MLGCPFATSRPFRRRVFPFDTRSVVVVSSPSSVLFIFFLSQVVSRDVTSGFRRISHPHPEFTGVV